MNPLPPVNLQPYQRHIHLDFHTSPFIHDVGADFDAHHFAAQLAAAHVNSIAVFAKCHHGMCYYPTASGVQHPALKGHDLFGEMVEALKQRGIRTVAYTTVAWEEDVAHRFPQWRQMKKDGTFANVETSADGHTRQPAGWKFNNFLHPDYQDYFEAHLKEVLQYDIDGFFIDIVFYHPQAGWDEQSLALRRAYGWMEDTPENLIHLEAEAQHRFCSRFTPLIAQYKPGASVFYNAPNPLFVEGREGIAKKSYWQTHYEIESLPSGMWGYYHFPRTARHLRHKGLHWSGMTGKFQKMWGDFGGIKPLAALEYECFRTQALGGANYIGDQLHPRGRLDEPTYQLIGTVFEQVARAEAFYEGSEAVPQIGVLCPNHPALDYETTGKSAEGVCLMLQELHYDFDMVDDTDDFSKYPLLILPDTVVVDAALAEKLNAYKGKLLLSYRSGCNLHHQWQLTGVPVQPEGSADLYPTYWEANAAAGWPDWGQRVFYQQGMNYRPTGDATIFINRVLPYFKRTDLTYCSHFQAPPHKTDEQYPAVLGGENWVLFADPVFREYRQAGNVFVRDMVGHAIEHLIGKPMAGRGLSGAIEVYPRRKGNDLLLTLLYYIPCRKALDIDVIEQSQSFAGELLHINGPVTDVYCHETGTRLLQTDTSTFALPALKGRLRLTVANFFA